MKIMNQEEDNSIAIPSEFDDEQTSSMNLTCPNLTSTFDKTHRDIRNQKK